MKMNVKMKVKVLRNVAISLQNAYSCVYATIGDDACVICEDYCYVFIPHNYIIHWDAYLLQSHCY